MDRRCVDASSRPHLMCGRPGEDEADRAREISGHTDAARLPRACAGCGRYHHDHDHDRDHVDDHHHFEAATVVVEVVPTSESVCA